MRGDQVFNEKSDKSPAQPSEPSQAQQPDTSSPAELDEDDLVWLDALGDEKPQEASLDGLDLAFSGTDPDG